MKKLIFVLMLALLAVSCSKTVEVKGRVTGGSPLERVEIIEASGVGTLPLVNMGLSPQGEFSGKFEAPKNGMYALTYGGKMNMIYLKKGQTLNISGNGATFPQEMTVTGDAKANSDFLKDAQKSFESYVSKINIGDLVAKDETKFLADFKKIQSDLKKIYEDAAKKYGSDSDLTKLKTDETNAKLLNLLDAYEQGRTQSLGKAFKPSAAFAQVRKDIQKDNDRLVQEVPAYRDYLLSKMSTDFQKYAQSQNPNQNTLLSEVFSKFLATKKDISQITKDYLFAYVMAQTDINYNNAKKFDEITKLIDTNIKDATIKKELKNLQTALMGYKSGTVPQLPLIAKDGRKTELSALKGKPTLVMFYASWNPGISINAIPVMAEVANFYKSKMNFAYVNLDDTRQQFEKTSAAMLKGLPGENFWVDGGINSAAARNFGLYGFKTPSFILLDKDGKISGRPFFNLGDPELVSALNGATGLRAPEVQPQMPPQVMPPAEPQAPKK